MSQSKLKSFFKKKPDDIESSVPSKRPRVNDPLHQELIDIESQVCYVVMNNNY